ncbi:unnamed protein product [Pleuronectes platessa]|uniref:Uncharacterized protein n=1 Tax=Pleuronectes platessa TaxID=8262 RepID=A0A9N7VMT0_PLEPL|nr:unnamed protein product [Pleuronectes platessa]
MALQISALLSHVRALPRSSGSLLRIRADFQRVAAKFKHTAAPGSPRSGWKPATGPSRGHINAALRAEKFSAAAAAALWKSSLGHRGGEAGWVRSPSVRPLE